tara:strand:+ start:545 stop:1021 length:477 start_codon:yes stop_codon:yes gene_type:complete
MTVGHVYNHFILHTQHIFTLASLITVSFVFGNFSAYPKTTIPLIYRQELLGITATAFAVVTISGLYDIFLGKNRTNWLYLRKIQHLLVFIMSLTVFIFTAVFLNQGNIQVPEMTGFAVVSGIFALITLISFFYHFKETIRSSRNKSFRRDAGRENKLL